MILVQVRHLYIHWISGDPPQLGALRKMLIIIFSLFIFHFQCRTFSPRNRTNKAWLSKSWGTLQGVASHQVPRSGKLTISSPKNTVEWIPCESLSTVWQKALTADLLFLNASKSKHDLFPAHYLQIICGLYCCWQLRIRFKGLLTLTVILMSCQSCGLKTQVWPTPGTDSFLVCSEAFPVHCI